MATQHPDHGQKPFWHETVYIPTLHEARESFLCFSELGISEYKWDWEGKLVDEAVLERLLADYWDYFKKHPLGKEKFLTFRLPNPKVENEFRLGRALMGLASAAGLAKQMNLHSPPLFEVILPMTESAEEMIDIQEAFAEIAHLKHRLYHLENTALKHIEIIPLFERVPTIIHSDELLDQYLRLHQWKFGFVPKYLRPYVARSDPALNSGLVPTILAIKIALSHYKDFEKKHKLKLYPIVGVGTLPFRGSLTPEHPEKFAKEYKGIRTAIIQSAFRYDFPKPMVQKAIKYLEKTLPKGVAQTVSQQEEHLLIETMSPFEYAYQKTVEAISPLINHIAEFMPKRRERVQHIGLFGYSRGVGKIKLPRAISSTAALYSLGCPPELLGSGRGLKEAKHSGQLKLIEKFYVNLRDDMSKAGRFLYKPGIMALAQKSKAWKDIWEDILEMEKYLGKKLGPRTKAEKAHYKLSEQIHKNLKNKRSLTPLIDKQAVLRKSLG